MSIINYSEGLFLGKVEQERLSKFMQDEGFQRKFLQQSLGFGLVGGIPGETYTNAKVSVGTNPGTISLAEGSLIDKNGNRIFVKPIDNQAVADDGNWHWVKSKYTTDSIEEGIVSVDASGTMTGVGSKFTDVLRGKPNFPSTILLNGSIVNTIEYEVAEVIDDNTVILAGDFNAESNLQYSVVGTFSPDEVPTAIEKFPFKYDSAIISLEVENPLGSVPALLADEEFFLARVKNTGGTIEVQDKRTQFWKLRAEYKTEFINRLANPLIGVEAIKYDNEFSTRDRNIVEIAWAFRSSNWSINTSLNSITLTSGEGGKYKSTTPVVNGDFNGWRLYVGDSGKYVNIESTTKSGSQVNLVLSTLDPDLFIDENAELLIAPDVDTVEIEFRTDASIEAPQGNVNQTFLFKNNTTVAKMKVIAPDSASYLYNVRYRYSKLSGYTEWRIFPSDEIDGYYNEQSFDEQGVLKETPGDRVRQIYSSEEEGGYIKVLTSPDAYSNFARRIDTGDIFGVERVKLLETSPVINLQARVDKKEQVYRHNIEDGDGEVPLIMATDHFINVKTEGAAEGNSFTLAFQGVISNYRSATNPTAFDFRIVENYVNSGDIGRVLVKFTESDFDQMNRAMFEGDNLEDSFQRVGNGLIIKLLFDGEHWLVQNINRSNPVFAGAAPSGGGPIEQWSRIGRVKLKTRYMSYRSRILVQLSGDSYANKTTAEIDIHLKVQEELGTGGLTMPRMTISCFNNLNFKYDAFAVVCTSNTEDSVDFDIMLRNDAYYTIPSVKVLNTIYGGDPYPYHEINDVNLESSWHRAYENSSPILPAGNFRHIEYGAWLPMQAGSNFEAMMNLYYLVDSTGVQLRGKLKWVANPGGALDVLDDSYTAPGLRYGIAGLRPTNIQRQLCAVGLEKPSNTQFNIGAVLVESTGILFDDGWAANAGAVVNDLYISIGQVRWNKTSSIDLT